LHSLPSKWNSGRHSQKAPRAILFGGHLIDPVVAPVLWEPLVLPLPSVCEPPMEPLTEPLVVLAPLPLALIELWLVLFELDVLEDALLLLPVAVAVLLDV